MTITTTPAALLERLFSNVLWRVLAIHLVQVAVLTMVDLFTKNPMQIVRICVLAASLALLSAVMHIFQDDSIQEFAAWANMTAVSGVGGALLFATAVGWPAYLILAFCLVVALVLSWLANGRYVLERDHTRHVQINPWLSLGIFFPWLVPAAMIFITHRQALAALLGG